MKLCNLGKRQIIKTTGLLALIVFLQTPLVANASGLAIPLRPKIAKSACAGGVSAADCNTLKKGSCPAAMPEVECKKHQETMKK